MSLTQYFRTNTGLPINKWTHYLPIYERHFAPFRGRAALFVEIGTGQGGSSRMWRDYLGPRARVVTLDVRPECRRFEDEQISVRIGSQDDPAFLQSVVDEFGPPDVVLDDGSHVMAHVKASFAHLFPRMAREGAYLVEDMHAAYWPAYGGGLRKQGTFIEDMKALVDEINADNPHHAKMGADMPPRGAVAGMVRSVTFYESVVAVEKGPDVDRSERSIPFVEGQTVW